MSSSKSTSVISHDIEIYQLSRHESVMRSLFEADYNLKPVQNQKDCSEPKIDSALVFRKFDRTEVLKGIKDLSCVNLKHVSTNDRSAPKVDPSVHIRLVERNIYLDSILVGALTFYTRMTANLKRNSVLTLAQMKAGQFYIASKEICGKAVTNMGEIIHSAQVFADEQATLFVKNANEVIATGKSIVSQTAFVVQVNANEAIDNGKARANETIENGKLKANEVIETGKALVGQTAFIMKVNANEAIENGKTKANEAVENGKLKANEAIETGKALVGQTAFIMKVNANEAIENGKTKANEVISTGQEKVHEAIETGKSVANEALESGKHLANQAAMKVQTTTHLAIESGKSKATELLNVKSKLSTSQELPETDFHTQVLRDIEANRQSLHHIRSKEVRDASKPFLPSTYALETSRSNSKLITLQENLKSKLLKDINNKAQMKSLNHVVIYHDASKPVIPKQIKLNKNERKKLLEEVQSIEPAVLLHSTETTSDRSAPVLPLGKVDVFRVSPMKAVLEDVKHGKELDHNPLVMDRSQPILSSNPSM